MMGLLSWLVARLPRRLRWAPHNVLAHPVSELLYQLGRADLAEELRESTLPPRCSHPAGDIRCIRSEGHDGACMYAGGKP